MHTKNAWVSLIGLTLLVAIIATIAIVARPNDEPVMLYIHAVNKDTAVDTDENYWTGSTQTVYYDSQVEYFDEYSKTGKDNRKSWKLEDGVLEDLQALLKTIDVVDNEVVTSGIEHQITYYDKDGNIIFDYHGPIDGNTFSRIVYYLVP